MYLALILNFIFEHLPSFLLDKLQTLLRKSYKSIDSRPNDSLDLDETPSEMSDKDVWFDGVDKRLIEAHSKKVVLVKGDDKNLLTKTPLLSYRGLMKKRKLGHSHGSHKSDDKSDTKEEAGTSQQGSLDLSKYIIKPHTGLTDEVALDCEMVECFSHKSVLARVSVVNLFGHPLLDSYVEPPAKVTDYRTRWSGIRPSDLKNAPSFDTVQAQVSKIIKDRIVVGHAIHNDFTALKLCHPVEKTRDTSHYYGRHYFLGNTPSLKKLTHSLLGISIQKGEHNSVIDAQATMKLYVKAREKWNENPNKIASSGAKQQKQGGKQKKQKTKPAKKKVKAFFVETI